MIRTLTTLAAACLATHAFAQDAGQPTDPPAAPRSNDLTWPADAERPMCRVADQTYTLRDVLAHIDRRHFPGMVALMDKPTGQAYLGSPLLPGWVRNFADIKVLEAIAKETERDFDDVQPAISEALRVAYQQWLDEYVARRERQGQPIEITQERSDLLLTDYQRNNGLQVELQGWLDGLVEPIPLEADGKLREFYQDHPEYFGGFLTIGHILIETRDPHTLALKSGADLEAAYAKLADVRSRLQPDGGNFEEIAQRFSDDRRTAAKGGRLQNVKRFEPRLPAALCRAVWSLRDGQVSEPFESQYGVHLAKRISYHHAYYVLYGDKFKPQIAATMRRTAQEDLLYDGRTRFGWRLEY